MSELDFDQARFNMIEQQIRPWDVLDQRVLDVLTSVPREAFVPERYRSLAFADVRIPLGHGQVMMNPNVEGRMLQALNLRPTDDVLEVGTGSGFITACLARLSARVTSVDIVEPLVAEASKRLRNHNLRNVGLATGNAVAGWGDRHYDVVAITGSVPRLADSWREQLKPGGRLFVIRGKAPIMEAILVTRRSEREWVEESLFETELPPLLESVQAPRFEF